MKYAKNNTSMQTAALVCVVGLGFLLRIYDLNNKVLTSDEFQSIFPSQSGNLHDFIIRYYMYNPDHPLLFPMIRYLWLNAFGFTLATACMLNVFAGTLSIVLAYLIAANLWNKKVGLWTAFLCAVSPFLIYQSQLVRSYPFLAMLYLLSLYAFIRALQGAGNKWWILNILANVLAVYTHLFGFFIMGVQGVFLLLRDYRNIPFICKWSAVQLAAIVPLYIIVYLTAPFHPEQLETPEALMPLVVLLAFFGHDLALRINGALFYEMVNGYRSAGALLFSVRTYIVLFYASGLAYFLFKLFSTCLPRIRKRLSVAGDDAMGYVLLFLWAFGPWAMALGLSLVWVNIMAPRFVWPFSAPALIMMAALLLSKLRYRFVQALVVLLLLGAFGYQLNTYYPGRQAGETLAVKRIVETEQHEDDVLLVRNYFIEADMVRFTMQEPDIPIIPVYSSADVYFTIVDLLTVESHQFPANNAEAGLWFFTYGYDFDRELFDTFLDEHEIPYRYYPIRGGKTWALYRIQPTPLPPAARDAIKRLFPLSEPIEFLVDLVGIENLEAPLVQHNSEALLRGVGFWIYLMQEPAILDYFVGFPLLERGAPAFVEKLALHLIQEDPDSAIAYLLLAAAYFEQNVDDAGEATLEKASDTSRSFANKFALALVPVIEALYIDKNPVRARNEMDRLYRGGMFFPQFFRAKAREIASLSSGETYDAVLPYEIDEE